MSPRVSLVLLVFAVHAGWCQQNSQPPVPQGERHPPSPCPGVFSYENDRTWNTRWYGVILLQMSSQTSSVIEIQLDRKADLLGTWSGTVSSDDNEFYTLTLPTTQAGDNPTTSFRFFVNFPRGGPVPRVVKIWKDRQVACDGNTLTITRPPTRPPTTPTRPPPRPPVGVGSTSPSRPINTLTTTERPVGFPGPSNGGSVTTSEDCGTRDSHAVPFLTNAQSTYPGQWPWHAAIYTVIGGTTMYSCGGTLVSRRVVVTAGHCITHTSGRKVYPHQLLVHLGKYDLAESWSPEQGVQTFTAEQVIRHPNYNKDNLTADIGMIVLPRDVTITKHVRVICLWHKTEIDIRSVVGDLGTVVGWGLNENNEPSSQMMEARFPIKTYEECVRSNPRFFSQYLGEKAFCAGYRNGTTSCNGDSGAGMVLERDSKWYLRGLVSVGVPRSPGSKLCSLQDYSIYVDVAQYGDWVKDNIPAGSTSQRSSSSRYNTR